MTIPPLPLDITAGIEDNVRFTVLSFSADVMQSNLLCGCMATNEKFVFFKESTANDDADLADSYLDDYLDLTTDEEDQV